MSAAQHERPGHRLVLASQSPSRFALLGAAGIEPRVHVSGVDEGAELARAQDAAGQAFSPDEVALVLARAKCEAVASELAEDATAEVVIGCDSVLELEGRMYGKPVDAADAIERWRHMSGRSGYLHTGHWIVDVRGPDGGGTGATLGATGSTLVRFAEVDDADIEAYVATGEPLHVAGAFTVDGLGGPFVEGIEGDHHNVVGISLPLLRGLLAELGVRWHDLRDPR